MSEYNLIYYRIEDERVFYGKRIIPTEYRLIDSITGENQNYSHQKLSLLFKKDEQNKKFRLPKETMARKRRVKIHSKEFQAYLNGESK